MNLLVNLSNTREQKAWFNGAQKEVEYFLGKEGLDGIELIFDEGYLTDPFPREKIKGLHLSYWPVWLDFWRGDQKKLLQQFKSQENIKEYYGGLSPQVMVDHYREEVKEAQELGVEYLVFHVSHVESSHIHNEIFPYSDWEVMEAASQLINQIFAGMTSGPLLLLENLWWPGLNFLDANLTSKFFNLIEYPNKGFMLDTGHLMLTKPGHTLEEDACDYILEKIENLGSLKEEIKGIHLNKSLLGACRQEKALEKGVPNGKESFWEDYIAAGRYILKWDQHKPFKNGKIKKVIDSIKPQYLVFEFQANNLEELSQMLKLQSQLTG